MSGRPSRTSKRPSKYNNGASNIEECPAGIRKRSGGKSKPRSGGKRAGGATAPDPTYYFQTVHNTILAHPCTDVGGESMMQIVWKRKPNCIMRTGLSTMCPCLVVHVVAGRNPRKCKDCQPILHANEPVSCFFEARFLNSAH